MCVCGGGGALSSTQHLLLLCRLVHRRKVGIRMALGARLLVRLVGGGGHRQRLAKRVAQRQREPAHAAGGQYVQPLACCTCAQPLCMRTMMHVVLPAGRACVHTWPDPAAALASI